MRRTMQPDAGHGSGSGGGGGPDGGSARGGRHPGGALAFGARIAGAAICAILLGVELAWIVEDVRGAGLHEVWSGWLGLKDPGRAEHYLSTGVGDAVLAAVLVAALVAARRGAAGWVYATAGLLAIERRLPGLWIFTADWSNGTPLRGRALATAIVFVVGGAALIAVGVLGRLRPVSTPAMSGAFGTSGATGAPGAAVAVDIGDTLPARPRTAAAVAGGLLLAALALEAVGWQIYLVQKYSAPGYPPHMYRDLVTGESPLAYMLAAPASYTAWAGAALAAGAAVVAFSRAPLARPLGMAVGFSAALSALAALDTWNAQKALFKTDLLPTYVVAEQSSAVFELVVGLLLLVLFAQRETGAEAVRPSLDTA